MPQFLGFVFDTESHLSQGGLKLSLAEDFELLIFLPPPFTCGEITATGTKRALCQLSPMPRLLMPQVDIFFLPIFTLKSV